MPNIIFYFTGTGNSLKVAKDIAKEVGDTTIWPIGKQHKLSGKYESIGFVYPVYCGGLPAAVERFVKELDIAENKNAYFFAVCTSGAMGGGLSNIKKIIAEKGGKLSYGENIKCFANYICMYPMAKNVDKKAQLQAEATKTAACEIKNRAVKPILRNGLISLFHGGFVKSLKSKDKGFNISIACNSCGICEKVCPVANIKIMDGKPSFGGHCEQCVACIQWCPNQAINYKNKTQNRGRYHHPEITVGDIINGIKL
ncbi:MAG: EFR1 family ferrodoxin [Dethiobacter sp.]|jgi:ferredoxin|nr:EFR1 family ferrodoxin [Dethiobacter sp.]MBS3900958.1 EFR1 family ferrodoxin [Dethiobacter sp.]MBS3988553.1 EFR1 family ferrodoxin [Dethiobacter sp.]